HGVCARRQHPGVACLWSSGRRWFPVVAEDDVDLARHVLEQLAGELHRQLDGGAWVRRALVAQPHSVAVAAPAIDEAKAIGAAAEWTWAVAPGEIARVDPKSRKDEAPLAVGAFFGRDAHHAAPLDCASRALA